MANIKQQKKRIGTAQRQRLENLHYKSTIKTMFRTLQDAVDKGAKEVAASTNRDLVRLLDRAATRGALHRNTASRKKARASRMLLQEPKTDTATIRRATKKKPARAVKPKADAATKAAPKKAAAPKAAATKAKAAAKPATEEAPVEEVVADAPADAPEAAEAEAAAEATDEA